VKNPAVRACTGVVALLLVLSVVAATASAGQWGVCERVIDGDTVWVSGVGKVRLIGVDTPELAYDGVTRKGGKGDEPGARRAREFVEGLLLGRRVRLEFDHERFDRYGRTLAYLYTEEGEPVNELLIREGLAKPIFYFSYTMKGRYLRLWRERAGQ
jgi:micrococcal nuclease